MGSVSVSSCRCCMFVLCVHPVAVLNAAFCMTCSLLVLDEDATGNNMEEAPDNTAYTRCSCYSGLANPVQIVSTSPAPRNGGQFTAGWLAMLLIKAGDIENNTGPTTTHKQIWIWRYPPQTDNS